MELYLDVLFLSNFLYDFILLLLVQKLLSVKAAMLRLFLVSIFSSLITCAILLLRINRFGFLMGLLLASFCVKVSFQIKCIQKWILATGCYYGLAFLLDGILQYADRLLDGRLLKRFPITALIGMILFAGLFVSRLIQLLKEYRRKKNRYYQVRIYLGGSILQGIGLCDSGNTLVEPITQKPVVVVEQSLFPVKHDLGKLLFEGRGCQGVPEDGMVCGFAIPYHAVGTMHGILPGVIADEIHILSQEGEHVLKKVMLGIYDGTLSQQGEYHMLLPFELYSVW